MEEGGTSVGEAEMPANTLAFTPHPLPASVLSSSMSSNIPHGLILVLLSPHHCHNRWGSCSSWLHNILLRGQLIFEETSGGPWQGLTGSSVTMLRCLAAEMLSTLSDPKSRDLEMTVCLCVCFYNCLFIVTEAIRVKNQEIMGFKWKLYRSFCLFSFNSLRINYLSKSGNQGCVQSLRRICWIWNGLVVAWFLGDNLSCEDHVDRENQN